MEPIRSLRNRAVVEAARLHRGRERRLRGMTLVEGPHAVEAAVRAGMEIDTTFTLPDDPRGTDWPNARVVSPDVMARLADTETPRGPVAVMRIPPWDPPAGRDLLALIGVGDPGNVGTIIRSAAAFGMGVAVGPGTTDVWAPKVLRAGAGTHFLTNLTSIDTPTDLEGHRLAASAVRGGEHPRHLGEGPWAFLIGSEAHGLDPTWVQAADATVTVPMPGETESLNVAVAASILAYSRTMGSGPITGHR